ncbi:hypothetical protein [Candidatus Rhabdochlamydia sp. T3358]|uniref:hypothetical protein n=1 Tax=Candidatus Rhabdochlamydia sp. T3358 TaxID=2099795 RepID=UPI0010B12127|nr:hypothetical protein [Candidatus Rhabdochlamydia sp. T3358]VHO04148.1 hypothetical protein RHT_01224 [Candidatus Rhabdochlamydia sp. T3358]
MSDITTNTTPSEKIIQPTSGPIKQKISQLLPQQQEELPYAGSTDPIPPEHLKQIEQELAHLHSPKQIQHQSEQLKKHATALKEFSEKDLQKIKQEIANLSPKQLEDLINQLKKNLSSLQATLTELKKQKKIDPEKADLILDTIDTLSSKDLQNLSKEDQQKLSNTLDALKGEVTDLINNKQIEPEVGNVLILFLAFAKAQMDQNDKAMLAGIQQTKVKTTQLELQAEKQKDIAGQSTQGRHGNIGAIVLFSLIAILGFAMLFTGVGAVAGAGLLGAEAGTFLGVGGALAEASITATAIPGAVVGAGVSAGFAVPAMNNSEAAGLGPVTQEGPDPTKMSSLQALLAYCNTQTQKLSSQLGSTEKMFVENTSDRSTQLGQQAGQAITEMGKIMEPR